MYIYYKNYFILLIIIIKICTFSGVPHIFGPLCILFVVYFTKLLVSQII
jgi:hypothetical protein